MGNLVAVKDEKQSNTKFVGKKANFIFPKTRRRGNLRYFTRIEKFMQDNTKKKERKRKGLEILANTLLKVTRLKIFQSISGQKIWRNFKGTSRHLKGPEGT